MFVTKKGDDKNNKEERHEACVRKFEGQRKIRKVWWSFMHIEEKVRKGCKKVWNENAQNSKLIGTTSWEKPSN